MTSSTLVIPVATQAASYTSFGQVSTIDEGDYHAAFIYNSDDQRARMEVSQNGNTILTRWYGSSRYMKETAGSTTKEYTWIGGDAYSAPAVAVKEGTNTTWYYLLRDYLGNITHQMDASGNVVAEYNFDPWGRRRDKDDWSYTLDSEPALFAGRGFTGHEHLPWFNLVNMNGRLYDPLVGRFLSPDNYVQMPNYTQGRNRYSYALNNPLVYKDPEGEFFFIDDYVIGFFKGLFSGRNPFKEGWNQVVNCAKIYAGLFAADTKREGWFWQIFSRFTWQLPQTSLGLIFAQTSNTFGNIESVDYYAGATVLKSRYDNLFYGLGGTGVTMGSYIIGNNEIKADPNNWLFQHEYGHYLQSQASGWAYLPRYAIPSLIDKKQIKGKPWTYHDYNPVEQDANARSIQYFYKREGESFEWDFKKNPIGYQGHGWTMSDYNSADFQALLKSLIIKPKWYDYAGWGLSSLDVVKIGIINAIYYKNHYVDYK
ncbi:MAG: RHS repeat domain-containing protein [Mangrovibacterium sp.]